MVENGGVGCTCIYTFDDDDGQTKQCRPWSDLPNDLLFSIASRLGRVDFIRFMNVCKGWLHSIKPRGHRNHPKPCLLAVENSDLGFLRLYTPFPSKTYKLRIPELKETSFRFSKDGWILLSKSILYDPTVFLLNMLTGAKFDLPDFRIPTWFCGVCFTSTPGTSDFMVFVLHVMSGKTVIISTYRPSLKEEGEVEEWTRERNENSSRTTTYMRFLGVSCNPVFYKGEFYCLDHYAHLGVFDPVRKNWRIVSGRPKSFEVKNAPTPDSNPPVLQLRRKLTVFEEFALDPEFRDFPYNSFMVDLEGDLISVFVNKWKTEAEEVHIFRLDCCKMGWEKVNNLRTGELFVGLSTSTISTVEVPYGSRNKLYFPGFKTNFCDVIFGDKNSTSAINHNRHNEKYKTWTYYYEAYSLETKAYDPSCSSFWRDPLQFTWIELPMAKWESIFYSKFKRM